MESDWLHTTIGDFIDLYGGEIKTGPFGTKLKASEYTDEGVPVISVGEVQLGRLTLHERTPKVDSSVISRMPEYLLQTGDIVFGRKGAVERSAIVRPEESGWFLGSDGIRLRLPEICDSSFIAYSFLTTAHKQWMIQHAAGTTMASLNEKIIRLIPITLPTLSEQKNVVNILEAFDDKIELNRQINTTLESLAQALFKSWFVDFDPVIDNALKAGNPIPPTLQARAEARKALLATQQTNTQSPQENSTTPNNTNQPSPASLPAEIQQLFPNSFVFTEALGWVPEGWGFEPVYNVAKFVNGAAFKSAHFSNECEGLPVVKIAELKNGVSAQTKFTEQAFDPRYKISDGDILFSWSGNPDTSIDTFIWQRGEGWLNQHIFKVSLHADEDYAYVYSLLKNLKPVFAEIARDKQTTGLGHITAGDMKRLNIVSATADVKNAFNNIAGQLIEKRNQTFFEVNTLISLRDFLLPKLLSGKIQIPEAEQQLAEVI